MTRAAGRSRRPAAHCAWPYAFQLTTSPNALRLLTGLFVSRGCPTAIKSSIRFFFGTPNSNEPGNYTILDWGTLDNGKIVGGQGLADVPNRWVIVSDPTGFSGYILTGDQDFSTAHPEAYQQLLARAKQLGVWGPITPTQQFPTGPTAAVRPGPADVPASVTV